MVEIIIGGWKLPVGIFIACVVCAACVALGIGIGWALPHPVTPSPCLDIQNQTMVQGDEDQVGELQNIIANLTAEVQRHKGQLKECDGNLSRSIEQIQMKTEEINKCKLERENCNQLLQACNDVGSIHKKHPWWLMVAVFSALRLYI